MPRKLFLPNIYVFFANICFNIKMADKIKNKYSFICFSNKRIIFAT
nr:MAG TPA: hypothetical protein [Caudoviricetes sp.]